MLQEIVKTMLQGQSMVRFIPAKELKDKYGVFGHFYSVGVGRNKVVNCRSVLEIVEKLHAPGKTSVLAKRKPDAVFIMMNPGSSRKHELALKLTKHKTIPVVRAWGVSPKLDPLIERCTSKITKNKTIRGLLKEGTTNKYLHPLPSLQKQKLFWVNRMVEQCQG